jgi:cellulose synthase/poly-beta-1,6-N-acetylglucosamine synthase-like glycosyltransferase
MHLSDAFQIFGIALALMTLPLVAELLALTVAALVPKMRTHHPKADSELFSLMVLVPAHNEEALVGRCVRSIMNSSGSNSEVLVIAHNCSDATAAVAKDAGATVLELNDSAQQGKGCALNAGFSVALNGPAQAVLVVDADSIVDIGLLDAVRRRFLAGAQALQCRYEVNNSAGSRRTKLMTLAFQAFNVIRPRGRYRLGLSAGILGNGFALCRGVLSQIPYGAYSVVEDLEYHLTLVRAGIRVEFVDEATVRGEMPLSDSGARTQRARWEGGRMRIMRRLAPQLMGDVLHGRLRMIEPLLDLLSAPIATGVLLLLIAACLPVAWLRLYVLGAFLVLMFHITAAASCGSGFWGSMRVLASAPVYILWKVWTFPEIWRTSRSESAWVRTKRDTVIDG